MSGILEEIQELSNKFSNLFEVEGLGDPAVDVPPSTNKIKRDRKTKDGKVEVVSVEDELFPYDGNKREQYRQKILDTINGMIQGDATLEDLLQIVRQKKAPLKEAMELLEELLSEEKTSTNDYHEKKAEIKKAIEKRYPDVLKSYPSGVDPIAKGERAKLEGSWEKAQDKQYQQEMKRGIGKGRLWNPTKNDKGDYKTRERSQADNETGGFKYKSHEDTVKGSQRRNAEKNIKQLTSQIKKAAKEFDNLYMKKQTDPNIDLHPAAHKEGNLRTEKAKQEARLFKLGEALSLMEAIINEVSERTKIDAYKKRANQSKLEGDIAKDTAKWHMDRGAYGPAIEVLKKADTAQKKEFKHRLNTMLHDKAFGQDAYSKAQKELFDEWKAKKNIKEAAVEKYVDNDGNTHELEFSTNKNKYKFDHKINGKSVVSSVDSEPNANYERKHAVKNYDLKKVEEALRILEGMFIDDGREDLITGKTPGIKVIQKEIALVMKDKAKQQKATQKATIQKRTLSNNTNQPKI